MAGHVLLRTTSVVPLGDAVAVAVMASATSLPELTEMKRMDSSASTGSVLLLAIQTSNSLRRAGSVWSTCPVRSSESLSTR